MAVSTVATSIRYTGNGSAVTTYAIPFQFLDVSHIYLAISSDGVVDPVLQSPSAYEVVRNVDGSGGTLRTVAAVTSPATVTIFRTLPFTQPSRFQLAGPFPANTAETALDRLLMQIQQLNTRLLDLEGADSGVPAGSGDGGAVLTWADATARALVKPGQAGQLGVQRDTQTVWIAQSATAGDWQEFARRRTNRIVIGLCADAGSPGTGQDAAAQALIDWDVDAAVFAGDNNYSGAANYNDDWDVFTGLINSGIAYPALGNHDVDEDGWQTRLATKFPYLPGNKRYYRVTLGDGLVDLFVLNSGFNSVFDLLEPDGNTVGSVQHAWFVAQLALSRARWKIAVFHHPPVTSNSIDIDGSRTAPDMAWPQLQQMDLICCGHNHLLEILKWDDTMIATMGAISNVNATAAPTLVNGGFSDAPLWVDDENRGLGRIVASEEKLTLEVWSANGASDYGVNRRLLHIRDVRDFSKSPKILEDFTIYASGDEVPGSSSGDVFVTRLAAPTILHEVIVSNATADGSPFTFEVKGGVVSLATGEVAVSEFIGSAPCLVPDTMLPAGTIITISWVSDSRHGLQLSLSLERLS